MRRYFNQGTQKPKAGAGLGALGGSKKKENIEDKVGTATVKNLFAKKKMKALLGKKDKKNYKEDFKEFGDSRREVFATERMAKGGRVGYKKGSGFPDLNKDGKVTKADILMGRGVIGNKKTKKKKMKAYKSPMQKQVRKS